MLNLSIDESPMAYKPHTEVEQYLSENDCCGVIEITINNKDYKFNRYALLDKE